MAKKKYRLYISPAHMPALKDALTAHLEQISKDPASYPYEYETVAELISRAEVLESIIDASQALHAKNMAYYKSCNNANAYKG